MCAQQALQHFAPPYCTETLVVLLRLPSCMPCRMETMPMSWEDLGGSGSGDGGGSDDLFELVWRGGQPSCKPLSSRRRLPTAPPPAATPSEDEMASWLVPIVCGGEELAGGGDAVVVAGRRRARVDDDQTVPSASGKESSPDHKVQARGRRRSRHHAEAHSRTEKRRRLNIKEKLKTLQQLVPGCHNSNQASTLDQTIRYAKSLQQHIQAMSFRCGMKPTSVAVYPVVQQSPCLPCWQGGTSVQRDGSWALPSYSSVLRPCFHGFTFTDMQSDV